MSRHFRCLKSSLRPCLSTSTPWAPQRETRRYVQAALKTRSNYEPKTSAQQTPKRSTKKDPAVVYVDEDEFGTGNLASQDGGSRSEVESGNRDGADHQKEEWPSKTAKPEPHFAEHLNALFSPLQFPSELARRILTHGSHPAAVNGHNANLSFVGRRVLESYLLLFLNSSTALRPKHDIEDIAARTLNTYVLGEHVGSTWGLGRTLRWTPTVPAHTLKPGEDQRELLKSVGLYKVQGDAVAAVIGGIYNQFGASVSHRVFHTRLLPNILLPGNAAGLPDVFHNDAEAACERMGGVSGNLVLSPGKSTNEAP